MRELHRTDLLAIFEVVRGQYPPTTVTPRDALLPELPAEIVGDYFVDFRIRQPGNSALVLIGHSNPDRGAGRVPAAADIVSGCVIYASDGVAVLDAQQLPSDEVAVFRGEELVEVLSRRARPVVYGSPVEWGPCVYELIERRDEPVPGDLLPVIHGHAPDFFWSDGLGSFGEQAVWRPGQVRVTHEVAGGGALDVTVTILELGSKIGVGPYRNARLNSLAFDLARLLRRLFARPVYMTVDDAEDDGIFGESDGIP